MTRKSTRIDRSRDAVAQGAGGDDGPRASPGVGDMGTPTPAEDADFLRTLGARVRDARARAGVSRRTLARETSISERYLARLEAGTGNISVLLLRGVARALGVTLAALAGDDAAGAGAAPPALQRRARIALIGLRGAGKSTLGDRLARSLAVPFVELDREIERESGLGLAAIFEVSGQDGFRRLERRCLERILASHPRFVLATSGSIVSDADTYDRLRATCFTIWLRAKPEEHMARVIAQGDLRPMGDNREAMDDLRRILAAREARYALADAVLDTSGRDVTAGANALRGLVR